MEGENIEGYVTTLLDDDDDENKINGNVNNITI